VGEVVLKETVEDFERSHGGFGQSTLKQAVLTYFTALRGGFKLLSMSESMENKVQPFSARSHEDFSPL
jgi:hypothetical protein